MLHLKEQQGELANLEYQIKWDQVHSYKQSRFINHVDSNLVYQCAPDDPKHACLKSKKFTY